MHPDTFRCLSGYLVDLCWVVISLSFLFFWFPSLGVPFCILAFYVFCLLFFFFSSFFRFLFLVQYLGENVNRAGEGRGGCAVVPFLIFIL